MFKKILYFFSWVMALIAIFLFAAAMGAWQNWSPFSVLFFWMGLIVGGVVVRFLWRFSQDIKLPALLKAKLERGQHQKIILMLHHYWQKHLPLLKIRRWPEKNKTWYLLLGEQVGKSQLMHSLKEGSHVNYSTGERKVVKQLLHWWIFPKNAFLEIGSKLLAMDKPQLKIIEQLLKWIRRLGAPTGIILCIDIEQLLEKNSQAIIDDAERIRYWSARLQQQLHQTLPLYVVITQMDKLAGFDAWTALLSEAQQQAPLGYIWKKTPVMDNRGEFIRTVFDSFASAINLTQMSMLTQLDPHAIPIEVLRLSDQLNRMVQPLSEYLGYLGRNKGRYQTPQLQALWLTSKAPEYGAVNFFAQDLFSQTLPTLSYYLKYQRINDATKRRLILSGTVVGVVLLLLGYCYHESHRLLQFKKQRSAVQLLNVIQESANHQWTSRLANLPFLPALQHRLTTLQRNLIQALQIKPLNFDQQLSQYQQKFMAADIGQRRSMLINLAKNIHFIRGIAENKKSMQLLSYLPSDQQLIWFSSLQTDLSADQQIVVYQAAYHELRPANMLDKLQKLLQQLLQQAQQHQNHWLYTPNSTLLNIDAATYLTFLPKNKLMLDAIYSLAGEQSLHATTQLIESALNKQNVPLFKQFYLNYSQKRQTAWRIFLEQAVGQLPHSLTEAQWQAINLQLTQQQGPYAQLLGLVVSQLGDITPKEQQTWLHNGLILWQLQQYVEHDGSIEKGQKLTQHYISKLTGKINHYLHLPSSFKLSQAILQSSVISDYQQWRKAQQTEVTVIMTQPFITNQLTQQLFTAGTKSNPLVQVQLSFAALAQQLEQNKMDLSDNLFWMLLKDQNKLLTIESMDRTAHWLTLQWQQQVVHPMLAAEQSEDYHSLQQATLQNISQFIEQNLSNGLSVQQSSIQPSEWMGISLPFDQSFITILNQVYQDSQTLSPTQSKIMPLKSQIADLQMAQQAINSQLTKLQQQTVDLTLQSAPVSVNKTAHIYPTGTQLTVTCKTGIYQLNSSNLMNNLKLNWQVNSCSRVDLQIQFEGADLIYSYQGAHPVLKFLEDYQSGSHRYALSDFSVQGNPDGESLIQKFGVDSLIVHYSISPSSAFNKLYVLVNKFDKEQGKLQQLEGQQQNLNTDLNALLAPKVDNLNLAQINADIMSKNIIDTSNAS